MATEKTSAIVLRVVDFSETSCVVTLFTEHFGKIGALAKGARRPKGPFDSALDLLAVCRIVFIHKSSESLDLLTEARLERRFRSAARDLSRLYAGYYVAELLQDLTDLGDPHPDVYHEADRALLRLDREGSVPDTVLSFEVTLLRLLGFLPALAACAICGKAVEGEDRALFGYQAGGLLCRACRPGQRQVVSLGHDALRQLRQLALPETAGETLTLDRRTRGELRGLLNHYLTSLLGHPPRMHKYSGLFAG
jgi:DNA repair protein RecO (recombination protein O)